MYLFKTKKSAIVVLSCVFIDVKLYITNLRLLIQQLLVWSDHKFNTFENTRVNHLSLPGSSHCDAKYALSCEMREYRIVISH